MQSNKFLFIFICLIFLLPYSVVSAKLLISNPPIHLTVEENAFIKSHPIIRVANEMDWAVFDYNQNGIAKGLSIEYINVLFNKAGLDIQYINGYTWAELVSLFKQKKIDVLPAIYKTKKRQSYLLHTTAYYQIKLGIFINKNNQSIEKEKDLSEKRVGIITSDASFSLIKKRIPSINLIEIDTNIQLLQMLSENKLDAIVGSPLVFKHSIKEAEINNVIFINDIQLSRQEQKVISLHFGIRKDWPILHRILQKLVDTTTNKEMRELEEKWIPSTSTRVDEHSDRGFLNEQELQFISSHPVLNVHMEDNYTPFSNIENNNQFIGYSIDYANMIADRLGINFEYNKSENWDQALSHLKSKQIDIVAQMINTKERQQFTLFTDDYMTYYQAIVVKKNNIHLDALEKLQGKKVAVIKGYNIEQVLDKEYPKIKIVNYPNNQALLNAVRLNKVDAAISTHQVIQYNINALFLNDIISIPILNNPYILETTEAFGVRNDWPLMHSALQKAFASITSNEVTELQLKWFGQNQQYGIKKNSAILSDSERAYLSKKEYITLCVNPEWMPFEKIKAGQHVGMAADYLNLIRKDLPIPIKLLPTLSWTESLNYIKAKKCDILSLVASTPNREKHINFTTTYLTFPIVIATKPDVSFIADFYNLHNKKIGITKGCDFFERLKIKYPNLNIVVVESRKEGLEKVVEGELFGFVGSIYGIAYMFQTEFIGELKIAGKFDQNISLSIGVRDDDPILLGVLEKLVKNIDENEKQTIFNKKIAIKYESTTDYTLVWQILVMAILLLSAAFYWNHKLKFTNEKLELTQKKLREQAHRDPLTNLYNRRYFHEVASDLLTLCQRNKNEMSTIMLDIDKFKVVNDTYGHSIGDDVLKKLAKLLREHTRASDIIARFGGEEFVILLPDTAKQGALQIAEKLREIVASQSMQVDHNDDLRYTISLGVDSVNVNDQKIDQSLNRADNALYQAKNSGRNRVV